MKNIWNFLAAAATAVTCAMLVVAPADGQAPYKAPRLGTHPNLNGIWQALNTANWDPRPHDAAIAPAAPEKLRAAQKSSERPERASKKLRAAPEKLPAAPATPPRSKVPPKHRRAGDGLRIARP